MKWKKRKRKPKTEPEPAKVSSTADHTTPPAPPTRDLNTTLGNFYEQPANRDKEMDELLERIASLETALENEKGRTPTWTRWR